MAGRRWLCPRVLGAPRAGVPVVTDHTDENGSDGPMSSVSIREIRGEEMAASAAGRGIQPTIKLRPFWPARGRER
jgi:hypothetical protein